MPGARSCCGGSSASRTCRRSVGRVARGASTTPRRARPGATPASRPRTWTAPSWPTSARGRVPRNFGSSPSVTPPSPVARRRALAPARGADAGGHAAREWLLSARRGGGGAPRAQGRGAAPGLRGRRDGGARRGPRPVAPRQPVHGRAQGRGPRARLSAPASDARRALPIAGRAPLGWPGPRRRRSGSPRAAPPRTGTRRRTVPKTTTGVDQTSYFSVVRRADVVSAGRVVFLPSSPLRGGPPLLLKET